MKKGYIAIFVFALTSVFLSGIAWAGSTPTAMSFFTNSAYNKNYTDGDGLQHTVKVTKVGETWNRIGTVIYNVYYSDSYEKNGDSYTDAKSFTKYYDNARPTYPKSSQYSVYRCNWYSDGHYDVVFDYRPKSTPTKSATPKPTTKPTAKPTVKPTTRPTAKPTTEPDMTSTQTTPIIEMTVTPATSPSPLPSPTPSPTPTTSTTPQITTAKTSSPTKAPTANLNDIPVLKEGWEGYSFGVKIAFIAGGVLSIGLVILLFLMFKPVKK